MVFDTVRHRVLLFGGQGATNQSFTDLWSLEPAGWVQLAGGGIPGRTQPGMAFDSVRGECLVFGGRDGATGAILGDTWTWSGTAWSQRATSGPPPRRGGRMVYDPVRNRTVLFGGYNDLTSTYLADTWEWNGSSWSQVAATGPAGVVQMAYESARHAVVMIATSNTSVPAPQGSDIWEFTGGDWVPRLPTGIQPAPRVSPAATFDDARGVLTLFGGVAGSSGVASDTWEWDGAHRTWAVQPVIGPSARYGPEMCFDTARAKSVLFGGVIGSTGVFGDTWEFGPAPTSIWTGSYDASLGLLPQSTGWQIVVNTPQAPQFVDGALQLAGTAPQYQYFSKAVASDFITTGGIALEADIKVVASGYDPFSFNWRTGFFLQIADVNRRFASLGIAAGGIRLGIDADLSNGGSSAFIPFNTTDGFHTYRIFVQSGTVFVSVDGSAIISHSIGPSNDPRISPNTIEFGTEFYGGPKDVRIARVRWGGFGVAFGSAGPGDNAVFTGTRPDPGDSGPPTTFTFSSLTVNSGSNFTLGSNEVLDLNGGTLYIEPGAVFRGNGVVLGNVVNAGLLIVPITRASIINNVVHPPGDDGGTIIIVPPERFPTPQPPIVLPFPPPPSVNPGIFVGIGGSGFGGTNGGSGGGGGGGGGYWPGWYQHDCLANSGGVAWDGRLDVTGFFQQTPTGTLRMFIAGTTQGQTYSFLKIGTTADLDGTVQVVLQPELFDYLPHPGDSFDLIAAAQGITLQPGFHIRTLMTAQGAAFLGLNLPDYSSGFASDPNQLVSLPQELFQYSLVDGGHTLRVTMTQPVDCRTPIPPAAALTCPNGAASFLLPTSPGPAATYQWQYRGTGGRPPTQWTDLAEGANEFSPSFILETSGVTARFLNVAREPAVWPVLGLGAGGEFRCLVSDTCGTTPTAPAGLSVCKSDVNCSQDLTVQDLFDFLTLYFAGSPLGDFNASGSISIQDIFDFLSAFFQGC